MINEIWAPNQNVLFEDLKQIKIIQQITAVQVGCCKVTSAISLQY